MGVHDHVEVMNAGLLRTNAMAWKAGNEQSLPQERLPFTVGIARGGEDLEKAVRIRHEAYRRHVPGLADMLKRPELYDTEDGAVVLLAESRLDGSPLGSLRLQTNAYRPLRLEESVELPLWLQHRTLAEGTRLGVTEGGVGRMVKVALIKAFYLYCLDAEVDWIVITARKPLDRQYEALLYRDVFAGGEFFPMRHIGDIPHRVMAFEVRSGEARWAAARHPLFTFMCRTYHPDINLAGAVSLPLGSKIPSLNSVKRVELRQ